MGCPCREVTNQKQVSVSQGKSIRTNAPIVNKVKVKSKLTVTHKPKVVVNKRVQHETTMKRLKEANAERSNFGKHI